MVVVLVIIVVYTHEEPTVYWLCEIQLLTRSTITESPHPPTPTRKQLSLFSLSLSLLSAVESIPGRAWTAERIWTGGGGIISGQVLRGGSSLWNIMKTHESTTTDFPGQMKSVTLIINTRGNVRLPVLMARTSDNICFSFFWRVCVPSGSV